MNVYVLNRAVGDVKKVFFDNKEIETRFYTAFRTNLLTVQLAVFFSNIVLLSNTLIRASFEMLAV